MRSDEFVTENQAYTQQDFTQFDRILRRLCKMVKRGQAKDSDHYGMVAACIIDPHGREVYGINYKRNKLRVHAERAAVNRYIVKYQKIPPGSVVITTCSPCSGEMADRHGSSCTDLLHKIGVTQVYCGYSDPTQDNTANYAGRNFEVNETANEKLREFCKKLADTFLK